jgi:hypothetical protein
MEYIETALIPWFDGALVLNEHRLAHNIHRYRLPGSQHSVTMNKRDMIRACAHCNLSRSVSHKLTMQITHDRVPCEGPNAMVRLLDGPQNVCGDFCRIRKFLVDYTSASISERVRAPASAFT